MSTDRKYLEKQIVLVGYGRVGRRIANALKVKGIPYIVAEHNREKVEDLRNLGVAAVSGDAAEPSVLVQAHIAKAAMLVIAAPDPINARKMVDTARILNPNIEVVLRTNNEDELKLLREDNVGAVFFGKEELANGMINHVLHRFSPK
jgi:CPA2 family monovalent cation:H+ antiporter-2